MAKRIAHRGNMFGSNPKVENSPDYLREALEADAYYVECDVNFHNNKLFLGHDAPQYELPLDIFFNPKVFFHCKDLESFFYLENIRPPGDYFMHTTDDWVLTAKKSIWVHPKIVQKISLLKIPQKERMIFMLDDSLKFSYYQYDCGWICGDKFI